MTYELYILLTPTYSLDELEERIGELVAAFGQQSVQLSLLKKEAGKSLSYPIKTYHKAHALLFSATSAPGVDIEKVAVEILNPQEDVLRRLVFRKQAAQKPNISREEATIHELRQKDTTPAPSEEPTPPTPSDEPQEEADTAEIDKKIEELLQ